jgi:hypothetical protein
MSEKPERAQGPRTEPPQPRRPSYENVAENIDKWANSSGLQKPK